MLSQNDEITQVTESMLTPHRNVSTPVSRADPRQGQFRVNKCRYRGKIERIHTAPTSGLIGITGIPGTVQIPIRREFSRDFGLPQIGV